MLSPLADLVVDNTEKDYLLKIVTDLSLPAPVSLLETTPPCHCERSEAISAVAAAVRTRSLIKIQDGCSGPCTYCIVPRVRPRERSLPASQIIDEVKHKVDLGYKEVVLTGTKVGSYEEDGTSLWDLVQRILRDTSIERLRLSSLQPSEISPQLLGLWQNERLCRHFHLALQSGSETVLQRMRRSYSLDQYQRTMNLIKDTLPEAAVTTDIIVGFPGETDQEFEQSYSFCQQAGFANIHVFPFSPRPETTAARMPNQVRDEVKQERNQRMLELSQDSRRRFYKQFLGQTMSVLWEQETRPGSGIYSGLTTNYIRVFARNEKPLSNKITPVRLVELDSREIQGQIVDADPR
jgi:threonylcarbamoyladenosine tRNA methylthiotransferase MtaB